MTKIDDKVNRLEETIAHLVKSNEELSDELALQWKRIERLESSLKHFEDRFAELESGKSDLPDNQKPPHW